MIESLRYGLQSLNSESLVKTRSIKVTKMQKLRSSKGSRKRSSRCGQIEFLQFSCWAFTSLSNFLPVSEANDPVFA